MAQEAMRSSAVSATAVVEQWELTRLPIAVWAVGAWTAGAAFFPVLHTCRNVEIEKAYTRSPTAGDAVLLADDRVPFMWC